MSGLTYALTIGGSPASGDLIDALQSLEVESSIEVASVFRLRLGIGLTTAGDWSVLADDMFKPLTPVSVALQAGIGAPVTVINAYVSSQRVVYGNQPGGSTLEVEGMDATLLMNLQEVVKAWPNQSDGAIATTIFGTYNLTPLVQSGAPRLADPEGTIMQRSTDIRFLRRLAQRSGYDCYVQPDPSSGQDAAYFRPRSLTGPAEAVVSVGMSTESNVGDFAVRYEMTRPTGASTANVDAAKVSAQSAQVQSAAQQALGTAATLSRITPKPAVLPAQTGLNQMGDLQDFGQSVVDRSSWALIAQGRLASDGTVLQPGGLINVRGAGRLYNGSYFITRVTHTVDREGYTQRFEASRNAVGMTGSEVYI